MKIAGVSMTYNDGYKLKEWIEHYNDYKSELDYFIIVDNGSQEKYLRDLEIAFKDVILIKRKTNGGCTAAYNDGIRYALSNTDADAIVIIGNDMKLAIGCLRTMCDYLYSDNLLGIVSTAILSINSTTVENYGHKVSKYIITELEKGKDLSELRPIHKYTDLVTGGFYMAKREFYENVGLQDENLFMYGDEFDTSIRTRKAGYKTGVTCETYAWHWHINEDNTSSRKPASSYLIARNRIYIARKHYDIGMMLGAFWYFSIRQAWHLVISGILKMKMGNLKKARYCIMGGINGLRGDMSLNKYTKF